MFPESLVAARKLLEEITPLQTDCGLVCGGADTIDKRCAQIISFIS